MRKIVTKYFKSLLVVSLLLLICNLLSTGHPYLLKQVLDIDFSNHEIEKVILRLILFYIVIHVLLVMFKNLRNILINKTICKIIKDIREEVFAKVLKFKMATFYKYNSAEIYTRLTDDVDNLFKLFFGFVYMIVNNILRIVFMIMMMLTCHIKLAIIGIATVISVSMVAFQFAKILGQIDRKTLQIRDKENQEYSEMYHKNRLTYLFKLQQKNIQKTNQLLNSELRNRRKYIFIHHFPYWILSILQAIGIYAILYYALNIEVSISLGSIYLVLFYTKECRSPLENIFNQLESLQTCMNSYKRIKELLSETNEERMEEGEVVEDLNGDIEFENVCMRYDKQLVLKDVSFVIPKGTKVTIAGKTGARKNNIN